MNFFTARGTPPPALAPGETLLVNGEQEMSYEDLLGVFADPHSTQGSSSHSHLPQNEHHPWVQGCATCGCMARNTRYSMRRDGRGWDCVGCMVNGFVEMKREAIRLGFHRGPQDVPAGPPNVVDAFRVATERYDDDARAKAVAAAEDSFAVPEPPRPAVQKKKKTGGKKGKKKRGGGKENKA